MKSQQRRTNGFSVERKQQEGSLSSNTVAVAGGELTGIEESKVNEFDEKNREFLRKISEKKRLEMEKKEEEQRKQEMKRERLRQAVLNKAKKFRADKDKLTDDQSENNSGTSTDLTSSATSNTNRKDESKSDEQEEMTEEELQELKEKQAKIRKFYRNRYASFLANLQDNMKKKQADEELEKQKKEKKIKKLRQNIGVEDVAPKVFENKPVTTKPETEDPNQGIREIYKKVTSKESARALDEEDKRRAKEASDKIRERQREFLAQLAEKKELQASKEREEAVKQEKMRHKLRKVVKEIGEKHNQDPGLLAAQLRELEKIEEEQERKQKQENDAKAKPSSSSTKRKLNETTKAVTVTENSSVKKPLSSTMDEKAAHRLAIAKTAGRLPMITDMPTWKKRNKVPEKTKVFMVMGGYPEIRKSLLKRGWVENKDHQSPCFDLKWTLKGKDLNQDQLLDHQIVNHFCKNSNITTKIGLSLNLRNLIWFANVDIDTFYPRCFDVSENTEMEDFVDDFKTTKAESILKSYVVEYKKGNIGDEVIQERVKVALNVCERRLKDLDDIIDDWAFDNDIMVTKEEWDILAADELNEKTLALRKHANWLKKLDVKFNKKKQKRRRKTKRKTKELMEMTQGGDDYSAAKGDGSVSDSEEESDGGGDSEDESDGEEGDDVDGDGDGEDALYRMVKSVLKRLKKKFPQSGLTGTQNIWILKPAGMSRGRGITVVNNLVEILDQLKGKDNQYVIQKYIEYPLVILKRKFDIRQWVLVTDWNPLTIWVYEEPYVRFGAEDYNTNNLSNRFSHLTNNSVAKYCGKSGSEHIDGNMWDLETFTNYLHDLKGYDVWNKELKKKIRKMLVWSLECVQDMVEHRKNSSELYGYDLMVDENMTPWLIEVNSSPAMDYSTPITKRLVKECLEDTIKVLVDYGTASTKKRSKVDTGKWKLAHRSKRAVDKPVTSFGLNLCLEGRSIKK
eukprot:CAMPEP_0115047060 /NCGR_PEP_ID=MMETSP0216-20121206/49101_1 /TAXON_ID=223996 /ORGANISM="Protocruzia adherens, Strain Boccale" /LENGTH=963 /DNA_ID=CAMNT_0002430223 /DNA_START=247 /DNA_END=3138 /DNA_ORIENTATION=-